MCALEQSVATVVTTEVNFSLSGQHLQYLYNLYETDLLINNSNFVLQNIYLTLYYIRIYCFLGWSFTVVDCLWIITIYNNDEVQYDLES